MLSNLDEQTNSLNFSEDEISNARSDNNFIDTNAVNPDLPGKIIIYQIYTKATLYQSFLIFKLFL